MEVARKAVRDFRDLRVWQTAMTLVEQVYRLTKQFPSHELYGLAGQMRRAAVSVPSNIAEGHARQHTKEYLQHVSVAQASLAELRTQLEIAQRLAYISEEHTCDTEALLDSLRKQLYALRNALANKEG